MKIKIYALMFHGDVVYVGQTVNLNQRFRNHKAKMKTFSTKDRLNHLKIRVLEEVDELMANAREEYWIFHYKACGQAGLNKNYFGNVTRSKKIVKCIESNITYRSLTKACNSIGILFTSARNGLLKKDVVKVQSFIDDKVYSLKYL